MQPRRFILTAIDPDYGNPSFETLLVVSGYEDWQIDWWIEDLRRRNVVFGTMLVLMAVDEQALSGMEFAARRALPRPNGNVRLVFSFEEPLDDQELRGLMDAAQAAALVKFRANARRLLERIGASATQRPFYELPPDRIADLDRLIVGQIESAMCQASTG